MGEDAHPLEVRSRRGDQPGRRVAAIALVSVEAVGALRPRQGEIDAVSELLADDLVVPRRKPSRQASDRGGGGPFAKAGEDLFDLPVVAPDQGEVTGLAGELRVCRGRAGGRTAGLPRSAASPPG